MCTELCFHNDLRLRMQYSSIQPWSQPYAIILFVLGLPELYINLPLSKLLVDSAMELWHMIFFSPVNHSKIVESPGQSTEVR